MSTSPARATLMVLSLFTGGVLAGAWAGAAAAERAHDPYASVDTLVRVLGLVESTYVDEIGADALVAAAIDGMLDELDDHSIWLSADRHRDLQRETHGSYTGIGVEVKPGRDGATITRVLPGSPASREGLSVGDRILAVDGTPLEGIDVGSVSSALLGPRGTEASLEVVREGWIEPRTVSAMRDHVHTPAVEPVQVADDVAVFRLRQFQEGAGAELRDALSDRLATGVPKGVVLDLRDNTGGLLTEAVAVSDLFLDEGVIVSTWGRLQSERTTYEATPGGVPADLPVVTLVNGLSASASEIVAGALQDTGRAVLVGERTYGKGSVQTVFEHRDGSALKLTIGRYYTPSGEPVAPADGRVPDVVVPWPADAPARDRLITRLGTVDGLSADARAELLALVDQVPNAHVRQHPEIPWALQGAERLEADAQLAEAVAQARALR